jgi:DNA-binding SARP family transcriptional activator/TolB-like protein/tetratricopeptide (TPR) repeat protein
MLTRLTTLGAARVHRGEAWYPDLPAQRLRFALLLYLAVEQDVSREEVVAMFWPDRDTARGKHALRQMLYELRQVLGEDWIDMRRDRIVVSAAVDATEFEKAAEAGRVEEALHLYGGPFLLGFSLDNRSFEAWADRRGGHLARVHRRLRRDYIAQLVADGRTEDALAAARDWVELDPLEDEAAHTLIERFAAAGQRTAALQYYDNYERQLAAELQVEPLDETRALVAAIRNGDGVSKAGVSAQSTAAGALQAEPPAQSTAAGAAQAAAQALSASAGASQGETAAPPADTSHPTGRRNEPASLRSPSADPAHAGPEGPMPVIPVRRRPSEIWRAASGGRRSAAALVLVMAILALGIMIRPAPRGSVAADRPVSIAVLPLNDHSMDGSLLPLANVLTEDLARGLAQSRFLDVISPNGVLLMRERGTPEDSLGRMLSADYLVGGSVSRYGDRVRVDVELLDGRTGRVVRSEVVERPWTESRNLVEDVVLGAAVFLRREVGTQIEIGRAQARTVNEDAWRLVVEAKAIQAPILTLLEAREFTAALRLFTRADSVLEIAAGLDRRWAEPMVLRGWVLERRANLTPIFGPAESTSRRELLEAGLAMAERAAQREADNAGVHALRGALLHQLAMLDGSPADSALSGIAAAEVELRRATELDPLNQGAWRRLADLLFTTGRYGEAKVAAERGYRLDPYGPGANGLVNLLFATSLEMGDDAQAEGWCLQGRRTLPNDLVFVYCLLALHAWADGIEPQPDVLHRAMTSFQQGDRRIQPQLMARFESMIAAAYARAGQPDSARAILRRVAEASGDTGTLWLRASAHAALGEDSAALDLLGDYLAQGNWTAPRVALSRPFWHLRERTELQRLIDAREELR